MKFHLKKLFMTRLSKIYYLCWYENNNSLSEIWNFGVMNCHNFNYFGIEQTYSTQRESERTRINSVTVGQHFDRLDFQPIVRTSFSISRDIITFPRKKKVKTSSFLLGWMLTHGRITIKMVAGGCPQKIAFPCTISFWINVSPKLLTRRHS